MDGGDTRPHAADDTGAIGSVDESVRMDERARALVRAHAAFYGHGGAAPSAARICAQSVPLDAPWALRVRERAWAAGWTAAAVGSARVGVRAHGHTACEHE